MFFIAYMYTFNGQVHAGEVKIVSHSSCRTSALLKYFCPLPSLTEGKFLEQEIKENHNIQILCLHPLFKVCKEHHPEVKT